MRKYLLSIIVAFIAMSTYAQRTAVDSAQVTINGKSSSGGNYFNLHTAANGQFWTVYIKDKTKLNTGHASWHGAMRIELRDTASLAVTDSLTLPGNGAILKTEADDAGNLYVLGYAKDSVQAGNVRVDDDEHYLLKLKPDMTIAWVNTTVSGDRFSVSPNGQYIYAVSDHNGFGNDVEISKLDATGAIVKTKTLTAFGYIGDVKTNNSGDVYCSGSCMGTAPVLDTVDLSHSFNYTLYYAKLDRSMTGEWVKIIEDLTCPSTWLAMESNGNILFQTPIFRTTKLDNIQVDAKGEEFIISSTAPDGKVHYVVDAPGTGHRVAVGFTKNIASSKGITAMLLTHKGHADTINWGNNVETVSDVWTGIPVLLEYDVATGTALYASYLPYDNYTAYAGMMFLDHGDMLVANTTGTERMKITKLRLKSTKPTTGIHAIGQQELSAYPNPTDGVVTLTQPVSGAVYGITGRHVMQLDHTTRINLSARPAGIYYLHTDEGAIMKLVKR